MADLWHEMGGDLALTASGDLRTVVTADATRQRVLRRLLTNPGEYIWHLIYGAGLPRFVGQVAPALRISATIRQQMRLERGVGLTPAPTADIAADTAGTVLATVRYADQSGAPSTIAVPL